MAARANCVVVVDGRRGRWDMGHKRTCHSQQMARCVITQQDISLEFGA
jgi:hypothetical protein